MTDVLQHIGMTTPSLPGSMARLVGAGAEFRQPPPTYYRLPGKREQILAAGGDPETWARLGILIDQEQDSRHSGACFLLQVIF